jgi:hypothetical protein
MSRAGRFLWLDWAQAEICPPQSEPGRVRLCAEHYGYRRLGVIHRRTVSAEDGGSWTVQDDLLPAGVASPANHSVEGGQSGAGEAGTAPWLARLHWLLPDWPWELEEYSSVSEVQQFNLRLKSPYGWVRMEVSCPKQTGASVSGASLCRAGEPLSGEGLPEPTRGWFSPTYGYKFPALSLAIETAVERLPFVLHSQFLFPEA